MEKGRINILWRGQCGGWAFEFPDGEITDGKAIESSEAYLDFYGGIDDAPFDGTETCEHGNSMALGENCVLCCEEFLIAQFAWLRHSENVPLADVVRFLTGMHGLTEVVPESKIELIVGDVFKNPDNYYMEVLL